jgi:hypothetical protein
MRFFAGVLAYICFVVIGLLLCWDFGLPDKYALGIGLIFVIFDSWVTDIELAIADKSLEGEK